MLFEKSFEMLAKERQRQIDQYGYIDELDRFYIGKQLKLAALCYIDATLSGMPDKPKSWPWDEAFWKPGDNSRDGKRQNLIKAGGLLFAELSRIDHIILTQYGEETSEKANVTILEIFQNEAYHLLNFRDDNNIIDWYKALKCSQNYLRKNMTWPFSDLLIRQSKFDDDVPYYYALNIAEALAFICFTLEHKLQ